MARNSICGGPPAGRWWGVQRRSILRWVRLNFLFRFRDRREPSPGVAAKARALHREPRRRPL